MEIKKEIRHIKVKKFILIILIIMFLFYLMIAALKFLKIHDINKKLTSYKSIDNYYYELIEYNYNQNIIITNCWYKDGILRLQYKENITWIDYKNNEGYLLDSNKMEAYKIKSQDYIIKEGNGLYSIFPTILNNNNIFIEFVLALNPFFSIKEKDYMENSRCYVVKVANQKLILEKETAFPITLMSNDNSHTNYKQYKIRLNEVTDKDIEEIDLTSYTIY